MLAHTLGTDRGPCRPMAARTRLGCCSPAGILRAASSLLLGAITVGVAAGGPIVLSGNEGKLDLTSGGPKVIPAAPPDTLTLLDFGVFPPRIAHLTNLPNTVIGPPSNIAISPDGRLALVANSVKLDTDAATGFSPDTLIHVLDLESGMPRRIGEVVAGRQPSGIAFTADGRHALVANRADGTVSLLSVAGKELKLDQTVEVCRPEDSVSDVAIHPGSRLVLASVQKGGYLAVLEMQEGKLLMTPRRISVYGQPYRCLITPDGQLALTAGQGYGNGLDADALSVVDLTAGPARTVDYVALGAVPESFDVSPDGNLVAAVVMSGSNLAPEDPNRSDHGTLVVLRRKARTLTRTQELPIGRIPEGVVFTSDGRHLVVQCHPDRELWIFEVRRGRVKDSGLRIPVPGMPSSLRASP